MSQPKIHYWIKTPCGRSKFLELSNKKGAIARIRLFWFVFIASIKDWNLKNPDQEIGSEF